MRKASCWKVFGNIRKEGDVLACETVSRSNGILETMLFTKLLKNIHNIVKYKHLKFEIEQIKLFPKPTIPLSQPIR